MKFIKIVRNVTVVGVLAAAIGSSFEIISKSDVRPVVVNAASKKVHHAKKRRTKKPKIKQATLILPKGYTRERLREAAHYEKKVISNTNNIEKVEGGYVSNPSPAFIKACMKGMRINNSGDSGALDSSGDTKKVNPNKLTFEQTKELTSFTLRLINEARSTLGLKPWLTSDNTQKLANDIATEYIKHKKSIFDNTAYDVGIVRASRKNGLNIDQNYIDNYDGTEADDSGKDTILYLKQLVYIDLESWIFGTLDSNYVSKKDFTDWTFASQLLTTGTGNENEDNETHYFALSISRLHGDFTYHFIDIPSSLYTGEMAARTGTTFKP